MEYIKAYPTQSLVTRTLETYLNAFRDYLLADSDITDKFDIGEISGTGFQLTLKSNENVHFSFLINSYNNTMSVIHATYFGENTTYDTSSWNIGTNCFSTNSYTYDLPLMILKDTDFIGFFLNIFGTGVMFAKMVNYDNNIEKEMIVVSDCYHTNRYSYGEAGTNVINTFDYYLNSSRANTLETYILYPWTIANGYTNKHMYIYDGGENMLSYGKWLIDNHEYAAIGSASNKGGQLLIALEDIPAGGAVLGTKNITENGTYIASDDEFDGYSKVNVNVSPPELITKTITESGTYTAADDGADGYSEVVVDVPSASEGYKLWETEITVDKKLAARSFNNSYAEEIVFPPELGATTDNSMVEVVTYNKKPLGVGYVPIPYVSVYRYADNGIILRFASPTKIDAGFKIKVRVAVFS